ncbi:MAG: hypothetical protein AVDCRST_MAG30-898 [uncultured Solirubrobacteraceae bacterium]|uniref:AbiEi antitoxin N-terminal domain-containing protein n=1 Tax=uncultured Solirubrobacteraceae bacterium TaxID=1162706 RepID=A0A6J4RW62_9ACTN|nr:MAG: hypothetical protein AVDCRST_MAG30-898 [uncultured Solirubrobacteraceae bacterium]
MREQLVAAGLTRSAIAHRLATGRLHRIHRGVYAVGQPTLAPLGRLLAAVMAAGPGSVLSHVTAAVLWGCSATPAARSTSRPPSATAAPPTA